MGLTPDVSFDALPPGEDPAAREIAGLRRDLLSKIAGLRRDFLSNPAVRPLVLAWCWLLNLSNDTFVFVDKTTLTREQAIERLVASEREIRALGVARLALFGSVLRDEARADSDIDLLVQFSPGAKTFDHFLALSELLEDRLGRRVELVTMEALSPFLGPRILAEARDVLRAA